MQSLLRLFQGWRWAAVPPPGEGQAAQRGQGTMLERLLVGVLSWLHRGERGQALGEYALVIALVVLAAVASLSALGMAVGGFLDDFAGKLDSLIS